MPYIELDGQSRGYSVTTDSITQTFVYKICFEDLDESDVTYGAFFTPNDDVGIAKFVYATFPIYRNFPISTTEDIILFLTAHSATSQGDEWTVTLTYSNPPPSQGGMYVQFGIELGGNTQKISRALEDVSASVNTSLAVTAPDTYRFIGVTKDSVEGADIPSRSLSFHITAYYTPDIWDTTILTTMYNLISTYNNALFYGFAAGEVLLLNITAEGDQYKMVPVTFRFDAKPNLNGVADAPYPVLTALGHHLIEYSHGQAIDQNYPIRLPRYRYVRRVFDPGNFNLLGL